MIPIIINRKEKMFTNVLLELIPKDLRISLVCSPFIQFTGIEIKEKSVIGIKSKLNMKSCWPSIKVLTESGIKVSNIIKRTIIWSK